MEGHMTDVPGNGTPALPPAHPTNALPTDAPPPPPPAMARSIAPSAESALAEPPLPPQPDVEPAGPPPPTHTNKLVDTRVTKLIETVAPAPPVPVQPPPPPPPVTVAATTAQPAGITKVYGSELGMENVTGAKSGDGNGAGDAVPQGDADVETVGDVASAGRHSARTGSKAYPR